MLSQKNAVRNVIVSTFPNYEMGGEVILKSLLTTEIKKAMRSALFESFRAGEVTFGAGDNKLADDVYLSKYVSGLLDNWVRKDPDFNANFGGGKYETKNPGSRAGSQDESIREMRKLLKSTELSTQDRAEIEKAINDRLTEIKPESVVTINVDAIPEHLRKFVK